MKYLEKGENKGLLFTIRQVLTGKRYGIGRREKNIEKIGEEITVLLVLIGMREILREW